MPPRTHMCQALSLTRVKTEMGMYGAVSSLPCQSQPAGEVWCLCRRGYHVATIPCNPCCGQLPGSCPNVCFKSAIFPPSLKLFSNLHLQPEAQNCPEIVLAAAMVPAQGERCWCRAPSRRRSLLRCCSLPHSSGARGLWLAGLLIGEAVLVHVGHCSRQQAALAVRHCTAVNSHGPDSWQQGWPTAAIAASKEGLHLPATRAVQQAAIHPCLQCCRLLRVPLRRALCSVLQQRHGRRHQERGRARRGAPALGRQWALKMRHTMHTQHAPSTALLASLPSHAGTSSRRRTLRQPQPLHAAAAAASQTRHPWPLPPPAAAGRHWAAGRSRRANHRVYAWSLRRTAPRSWPPTGHSDSQPAVQCR